MFITCKYVVHMSKMIQIRHVPDDLHRKLKARAALSGMSLTDYLLAEIRHVAERPTAGEIFERLRSRSTVTSDIPVAEMVREERDTR
jgi:antitoxin FitA